MGSVTDLVQGGLEYSFNTQRKKPFDFAADADVGKLRGSVPLHLVRCPVMASLSIEISICFVQGRIR